MSKPASRAVADSYARFVSEARSRIGKCVTFGCSNEQQFQALALVLRRTNTDWRRFTAGREGYIATEARAGLFRHRIAWGDHDQMGHVNNVRYNFWAETARINWARSLALQADPAHRKAWEELWTPYGIGLILRGIKTDYKLPLRYPDRVTVVHKLLTKPEEGMDALHLEALVLSESHQRIAARITEDIAVYDYRIGRKAPLPPTMVEVLAKLWEEQVSTAEGAMGSILELDAMLQSVEKETWDREDAVEDLGSASSSTPPS